MSWSALFWPEHGRVESVGDAEALAERATEGAGLLWVHVAPMSDDDGALLREIFRFHPLSIEDCQSRGYERPKLDEYAEYLFATFHGVDATATGELVTTAQLGLFLAPRVVVTATVGDLPACTHLLETWRDQPGRPPDSATMVAHAIIDALVDSVLPTADRLIDVATQMEEGVLARPTATHLHSIQRLRRSALRLHRATVPQREVLGRLARGDHPLVGPRGATYFRDVYDHLLRIEDVTFSVRERADSLLGTYLSAVSIRQNESMRTLAFVATVFLPLTLVAAIYGMNFENMPELGWSWGYFAVLGVMASGVVLVVWWFWGRQWLDRGAHRAAVTAHFLVDETILREVLTEAHRLRSAVVHGDDDARRGPPDLPRRG